MLLGNCNTKKRGKEFKNRLHGFTAIPPLAFESRPLALPRGFLSFNLQSHAELVAALIEVLNINQR